MPKESNTDETFIGITNVDNKLERVIKQRLLQLVSLGIEDPREIQLRYKDEYKEEFVCPVGKKHGLITCLKQHFNSEFSLSDKGCNSKIHILQDKFLHPGEGIQDLSNNQEISMDVKKKTTLEMNAEFPSLAEGAQSTKVPKHSKKESKKSSKGHSMPLQQFLTQSAPASNNNILSSANTSAVPKHNGYSQKRASAISATTQPIQPNYSRASPRVSSNQPVYPPYDHESAVKVSNNLKSAVYNFDVEYQHSGVLPTVDEVNQRVNHFRTCIAKEGHFVDVRSLCSRLCHYYKVSNVRELRCSDRRQGFFKERDIPAIKEFTFTANKILCIIQTYCTSSTIATLYDLERFICDIEKKSSFSDLKLGPLQKCPLIWYYFRFDPEKQICHVVPADIIKYLWEYGRKEKMIDLQEFLKYIATKTKSASPYDMGVLISSLPLAISITRKVKFGDYQKRKEAEERLIKSMEDDLDGHLKKLQRGLTGRNQRIGPAENVISNIAGMHIEDCIIEIFNFANKMKLQLQKQFNSAPGFLGEMNLILQTMMFFRSKPLWAKIFHVVVATCIYRKLGFDDFELLEMFGFQESLKKIKDEQMLERFGYSDQGTVLSNAMSTAKKRVNSGKLLEITVKWLENSKKPLDLKALGIIEQKIIQTFNLLRFEDLGSGSYLSFIQKENIRPYLGSSIIVSTEEENELADIKSIKDDIRLFVRQCGKGKSQSDICQSIRTQFKCTREWSNTQIVSVITNDRTDILDHNNITFIHAMNCGYDSSSSSNEPSDGDEASAALGCFTKEQAISCLRSAPLLENLAKWSCWDIVFAPEFGDLKTFLMKCEDVCAIETPSNELLKINLDSTPVDLGRAIIMGAPQKAAGHLLSIITANDGLDKSPVIHIANVVKMSLEQMVVEAARQNSSMTMERFILECMLYIPIQFCSSIVHKIFLTPLHEIVGDDYGRDPIPARILRACKKASEKSFLHSLGAMLAIKEWMEDFKQCCFISNENANKDTFLKNSMCVKVTESEKKNSTKIGKDTAIEATDIKEDIGKASDYQLSRTKGEEIAEDEKGDKRKEVTAIFDLHDGSQAEEKSAEEESSVDESTSTEEVVTFEDEEEGDEEVLCEEEERLNHCKDLIEKIRKEEFGIGEETDEQGKARQQKNNERLCRALDRLSKELYTKDTHFVLELIQNADDNSYDDALMTADSEEKPAVAFIIDKDRFTILNNERGFEDANMKAICDIGKSTKGKHIKGYIGQKGIGFKSIFRVTDCPEIHSNGFHICFDAREDKMGYILPTWLNEYTDYANYFPDDYNLFLNWRTQIDLPLKDTMMMSDNAKSAFQNIHPSLLLFLNRLQTLIIENKMDGKSIVMTKRSSSDQIVVLTQNGVPSTWFVFTKEISITANECEEDQMTDVSLAFPLDNTFDTNLKIQTLPPQHVHAFLPLRSYGFKFLIQADFEVPSSREDIDKDSPWNQEILKVIPEIFIGSFHQFLKCVSNEATMPPDLLWRAIKFFQFLPLESEIHGAFKPVARKFIQSMRQVECIPILKDDDIEPEVGSRAVDWVKPTQVLLGDSVLRKIISPSELKRYIGLTYMSKVMQQNVNLVLLKALGVHAESLDMLLEICKSHMKIISNQKGKATDTIHWVGNWLLCVSQFLEKEYDSSVESLQKIQKLFIFPLSNGNMVNLIGEAVFFPFDRSVKKPGTNRDYYIQKLEEDLNSIDPRIYSGMSTIDALKLERFLADLGVKRISEKEVIDSYIMPCLKSGKWVEKEHLVVAFLIYLKEQYFLDEDSVDIEALKQCAVILTNHGNVKPSDKQIYFTPKYGDGNEILDLKKYFPSVNWCLLNHEYLKVKSTAKNKSWQKFFRKLGVIDFPKMRRQPVSFHDTEMVNSHWAGLNSNWPRTEDRLYLIDDLVCPEFEEILDTRDHTQLLHLARVLDIKWKSHFHQLRRIPVRDSQNKEITTTISSFLVKLQTTAWLPGDVGHNSPQLCKPEDLYLKTPAVYAILDDFGHYFSENLTDSAFVADIRLRSSVNLETVFEKLGEWSRDVEFCTSVNHMINIYDLIKKRFDEVDPAELKIPLIFVPSEIREPDTKGQGKFYERGNVCLYDFSGVISTRDNLLHNKRILLFKYYPKDTLNFFSRDLEIDMTPPIRDYMSIACALADETQLPDDRAYNDLMEIFSTIGSKCISKECDQSFQEFSSTCFDLWNGYGQLKNYVDIENASFVYENLKEEKIFPTKRETFVSIKDKPLLSDDRDYQKIYEKEENVHFIDISVLKALLGGKQIPLKSRYKEEYQKNVQLKQKVYGILVFFLVCKVDMISDVSCNPEVTATNAVKGCPKWHKNFSELIQYLQRFIYVRNNNKYDMLVNDNISEKLRKLTFFTSSCIETIYRMKKREDINVIMKKNCCLEYVGENIYFYISKDSLDETDDILAEFVKIFYAEKESNAEVLRDLLCVILTILNTKVTIENMLEKRGIPKLPTLEEVWQLQEISTPVLSKQSSQIEAPGKSSSSESSGITCWPPRAQESLRSFPPKNQIAESNPLPSEWIEPAPPEPLAASESVSYRVDDQQRRSPGECNQSVLFKRENSAVEIGTHGSIPAPKKNSEVLKAQTTDSKYMNEKSYGSKNTATEERCEKEKDEPSAESSVFPRKVSSDSSTTKEVYEESQLQVQRLATEQVKIPGDASSSAERRGGVPLNIPEATVVNHGSIAFTPESQIQTLQCVKEEIPPDSICEKVAQLIVHLNDADTSAIGRYGEMLVYERLQKELESQIQQGTTKVTWHNKDVETGYPFDITIAMKSTESNDKDMQLYRFIEVKTTLDKRDKPFEISHKELIFALQYGKRYDIYRVGGVGSPDTHWIKYLPGFSKYVNSQTAKILIALKE